MNKLIIAIIVCANFIVFGNPVQADEQKGLEIATELERRDTGWSDSQASLQMILRNRNGDEHIRTLRLQSLEVDGDGDKSLSIFDSPRDVKGTAFLSFTHALEPDEQWLYMPALKRVKRISSSNKSGPFLGSEFAFEDLTSFEVKKYTYNYLGDEVYEGQDSFMVEAVPEYEYSGYTRQIIWVDKERYIPLKIAFYDRKNALLKTLVFSQYKQYLGQYWRADTQLMSNHVNGKSTELQWEAYQFRTGLSDRDFDRNTLKRAR